MFELPADFFTSEAVLTLTGLALVLTIVVQFTKGLIKERFGDAWVQGYVFIWALAILAVLYWNQGLWCDKLEVVALNVLLLFINAMLATMAAVGGYDIFLKKQ